MFDGYMSCALDATPCALKAVWRQVGVVMADCEKACHGTCEGLSLYGSSECWVYSSWSGAEVHDEKSVICRRNKPPPPPQLSPPPSPSPSASPPPPPRPRASFPPKAVQVKSVEPPKLSSSQSERIEAPESIQTAPKPSWAASNTLGTARDQQSLDSPPLTAASLAASLEGVPLLPFAVLLVGGGSGLVLLVVGCCLLLRRACCGHEAEEEFDDDDDMYDGLAAHAPRPHKLNGSGRCSRGSAAYAVQRVLVEIGLEIKRLHASAQVDGVVSTTRAHTAHCRTLTQLRRAVAEACAVYSDGARESSMLLEYLDERAGLAVVVGDDSDLGLILSKPTLKSHQLATSHQDSAPFHFGKASVEIADSTLHLQHSRLKPDIVDKAARRVCLDSQGYQDCRVQAKGEDMNEDLAEKRKQTQLAMEMTMNMGNVDVRFSNFSAALAKSQFQ
ncbi:MAG: hypothetical protein SGPRY_002188 [Prymnesium sp.]